MGIQKAGIEPLEIRRLAALRATRNDWVNEQGRGQASLRFETCKAVTKHSPIAQRDQTDWQPGNEVDMHREHATEPLGLALRARRAW